MLQIDVEKRLDKFSLKVCLNVEPGLAILTGPSGCGKTTLLNLIAGLLEPDHGELKLNGKTFFSSRGRKHVSIPVHLRQIGYVFQQPKLFPHLSVKANILFGLPLGDQRRETFTEVLDLFRLKGLEDRMPGEISGGQAQRVALSRALITRPKLLLLDEPFSALDNFNRIKLRRDIKRITELYRIPAILVTHDMQETLKLGGKTAVMDDGSILQYGNTLEAFSQPGNNRVAQLLGVSSSY